MNLNGKYHNQARTIYWQPNDEPREGSQVVAWAGGYQDAEKLVALLEEYRVKVAVLEVQLSDMARQLEKALRT